ncbi:hypothetical protein SVAN01_02424 [Stagonosporopsis vannaccii]|nr:hypothetical protein SVAN01_02424 [Stagonosporopsis vannaccii]
MVKQITVRPPMAPPTMAPRFVGSCLEEVEIVLDVEGMSEEFTTELDADTEDASTTVDVGREARLVEELPVTVVELDGVVVVSPAAFRAGKSLSVRASAPHAMYSKDWSGPFISSTVEQNCERSLIIFSSRNTSAVY